MQRTHKYIIRIVHVHCEARIKQYFSHVACMMREQYRSPQARSPLPDLNLGIQRLDCCSPSSLTILNPKVIRSIHHDAEGKPSKIRLYKLNEFAKEISLVQTNKTYFHYCQLSHDLTSNSSQIQLRTSF